jgi:hypothetical protein
MKIQVNSDKTVVVDASLTRFVEDEASRVLDRFAPRLTRVEVHLSDVDNKKTGQADKRCLIEVRPAGARPMSVTALATKIEPAVGTALGKMQRLLTTHFGKKGRMAVAVAAPAPKKTVAVRKVAAKKAAVKKAVAKAPAKLSPRGPKKKGIYKARRTSWPSR